jgi:hypothetical protein
MVVAGVLRHVARELCDPDLRRSAALKQLKRILRWDVLRPSTAEDGALEVMVAEVDEFVVHETLW